MEFVAQVNYSPNARSLVAGAVPFIGDENPDDYRSVDVRMRDARQKNPTLEKNGFALVNHKLDIPAASFFGDQFGEHLGDTTKYFCEMRDLIQRETGADLVLVQSRQVRDKGQAAKSGLLNPFADSENNISGYANVVHTDYSAKKAEEKLLSVAQQATLLEYSQGMADRAKMLGCRYMLVNAWRNLNPDHPIGDDALACCDATTVDLQRDAVRCEVPLIPTEIDIGEMVLQVRPKSAEQYRLIPDNAAKHDWYHYPAMTSDEVLIIKQFDSDPEAPARFCFHTSFKHPSPLANAPPRQSCEVRAIAFFWDNPRSVSRLPSPALPLSPPISRAKFLKECCCGLPWPELPPVPEKPAPGTCGCKHSTNPYHTCVAACGCACPPPEENVIPEQIAELYSKEDSHVQQQVLLFDPTSLEWPELLAEDVVLRQGEREIQGKVAASTAASGLHYGPLNRSTNVTRVRKCSGPESTCSCFLVEGEVSYDQKLDRSQLVMPFTAHIVFTPEGLVAERHTFTDTAAIAAFAAAGIGWPLVRSQLHAKASIGRFDLDHVSSAYDKAVLEASPMQEPQPCNEMAEICAL